MRIPTRLSFVGVAAAVATLASCVKPVTLGPLGEGSSSYPSITAVDSSKPPRFVSMRLDRDAYVVVLLVAPGHSTTLLYPMDSTTDIRHTAGAFDIGFRVPEHLAQPDTALRRELMDEAQKQSVDSIQKYRNRQGGGGGPRLPPDAPTYLLVITSPQRLSYSRVIEKTAGVSIPLDETEALNAVGKAVKSTLTQEPREWAGFYQNVILSNAKK